MEFISGYCVDASVFAERFVLLKEDARRDAFGFYRSLPRGVQTEVKPRRQAADTRSPTSSTRSSSSQCPRSLRLGCVHIR